ncbi:MAG: BLUF domain-containing protein [Chromatiales bacterium]|jgi:hypothetical protein
MYRLIYKSRCNSEITWETVRSILNVSAERNAQKEISGVLLASGTHFLQVLEGRFEDVNEVFMDIVPDARHREVQLVSFTCADARLFEGWGMRGIGVFDFNQDLADQLIEKYGEEEGGVRFPLEDWLALSMINDIRMVHGLPDWKR